MISADFLYTFNPLNITSLNFQPANVLTWRRVVRTYSCISSLWLTLLLESFLINSKLPIPFIPFSAQFSVPLRLVSSSQPSTPPLPFTCQWTLSLGSQSKPSFSVKLPRPMVRMTLSLAPTPVTLLSFRCPCTWCSPRLPLVKPIHPGVSGQCLASRRTFPASD